MYEDLANYVYLVFLECILKDFSRIYKLCELVAAGVERLGTDLFHFFFSLLQQHIVIPNQLKKSQEVDSSTMISRKTLCH